MANRTLVFTLCSFSILFASCADYEVTINQNPVYTPTPAASVKNIADENLAHCIHQTVVDQKATSLTDLKRLVCTSAGIRDLAGIEELEGLEELDLSSNSLKHATPLEMLRNLRQLLLRNNPDLSCTELKQLAQLRGEDLNIVPPQHCLNGLN